jgi:2-(1,2-epoxy-1,2-dihydrophenyl)acetyl-CoA isomerase
MRTLLEKLYAALVAGDQEGLAKLVAPHFVGRTTPGMPMGIGGEHQGRDEMWDEFWSVIGSNFDVRPVTQEWVNCGRDRMLVVGRYMGSTRGTGAPLDAVFFHLWTAEGGKVTALEHLTDSAVWIEALASDQ